MTLLRTLDRLIHQHTKGRKHPRQENGRTRQSWRPGLELLEDRLCLSGNLLVSSFSTNSILASDGTQVSFFRPFASDGGLASPVGLALGPTGDLFVSGRDGNDILRYDGNNGAFLDTFVSPGSGGLSGPHGLAFGPDGNLYVSSGSNASVLRYDGHSGTFLSTFVSAGSGGLGFPHGLTFGPDGNLYVGDRNTSSVLRYDGTTGVFLGAFVAAGSGRLDTTTSLVFGPDGNLYVDSFNTNSVLRYDGKTGAFLGTFASGGGLSGPQGLSFGLDGNLYVSSFNTDQVLRYNGATGDFLDVFASGGGLRRPTYLIFQRIHTTTLVTSSAATPVFGQSVIFTAAVNSAAATGGVPTGTVTFAIDGLAQTPVPLNNGQAIFTTTTLSAGSHTITASYNGDAGDGTSSSPNFAQTVNPAPLTVTADNKTKVYAQANPALTASYSGFVNGDTVDSLGGTLSFSTPATGSSPVGTYAITPSGLTSTNYTIAFVDGMLTISPAPLMVAADNNTKVYGQANPVFTVSYSGFVNGDTASSLGGTLSFSTPATTSSPVGSYATTPGGLTSRNYTIAFVNGTLSVTPAALTVAASNVTRIYGQPNSTFTVSYSGFVNGDTPGSLGGTLTLSTPAITSSPPGTYPIAPGGLSATNYTITFVNGTLAVTPAPLTASSVNILATAGAPFFGIVATFQNADPFGGVTSYTAAITWGDGNSSVGTITDQGGGVFAVSGSNIYADPNSNTISVLIRHKLGYTIPAIASSTTTVTSLGIGVQEGQGAGIGFWHNSQGQALINSFNGGANATLLASWLATTFPNLYGASAGSHNLTGKTNAQVAALYLSLFNLSGPKLDAQVLATALNVYATTLSLGGTAATAYGFTVNAYGLGAASVNVGTNGAAFGVANFTTLNVYELLLAANKQAVSGVLYNGDQTLANQAVNVFDGINEADDDSSWEQQGGDNCHEKHD
jgi:hypothetical protein